MAGNMLIGFPLGGQEKKRSYREDKPYATPNCLNVRPGEVIEGRERGGSRPGLGEKSAYDSLDSEVRMLSPMIFAPGNKFMVLREHFRGDDLSSVWSINNPEEGGTEFPLPTLTGDGRVTNDEVDFAVNSTYSAFAMHSLTSIDTARPCTIRIHIETPLAGDDPYRNGYNEIFARQDNDTPSTWGDGLVLRVNTALNTGKWRFEWVSTVASEKEIEEASSWYTSIPDERSWFTAKLEGNKIISLSYGDTVLAVNESHSDHSGSRVGFGVSTSRYLIDFTPPAIRGKWEYYSAFEVEYFTTLPTASLSHRTLLVASAGGNVYTEWSGSG